MNRSPGRREDSKENRCFANQLHLDMLMVESSLTLPHRHTRSAQTQPSQHQHHTVASVPGSGLCSMVRLL